MPLGSLLRPSEAVLDSLGPQKHTKNNTFLEVFANAGFRYFEALDGPLGRILAPLGPIWSQNSPPERMAPKVFQVLQKIVQKWTQELIQTM